ncbi:uncharacterized protein LOC115975287 [Quercus lobata]|uniref:uncharacterized protein LOC115975287 n=1 Tax=Quercus lobata TaxID=97700 RepID=UPI00124518E0|nr:uncharacterized protein LOC115975287 [Quercus lobata]
MIMAMNKVENVGKESHQEDLTNDDDLQICLVGDKSILDPPHVRTKGVTNKRIKVLLEKGKKEEVKGATTSQVPQASSMMHGESAALFFPPEMCCDYPMVSTTRMFQESFFLPQSNQSSNTSKDDTRL